MLSPSPPPPKRSLPLDIYLFSCCLFPLWLFYDATRRRGRYYQNPDTRYDDTNALLALIQAPSASNARSAAGVFIVFGMLMFFAMVFCVFAFLSDSISLAWIYVPTLLGILTWIETRRLLIWADKADE